MSREGGIQDDEKRFPFRAIEKSKVAAIDHIKRLTGPNLNNFKNGKDSREDNHIKCDHNLPSFVNTAHVHKANDCCNHHEKTKEKCHDF
jgi:hypothetical protein